MESQVKREVRERARPPDVIQHDTAIADNVHRAHEPIDAEPRCENQYVEWVQDAVARPYAGGLDALDGLGHQQAPQPSAAP